MGQEGFPLHTRETSYLKPRHIELLKERLEGIVIGLSIEREGILTGDTLIDNLEKIIAYPMNDGFIEKYQRIEDTEFDLEW